jgi:hypothetical protein
MCLLFAVQSCLPAGSVGEGCDNLVTHACSLASRETCQCPRCIRYNVPSVDVDSKKCNASVLIGNVSQRSVRRPCFHSVISA